MRDSVVDTAENGPSKAWGSSVADDATGFAPQTPDTHRISAFRLEFRKKHATWYCLSSLGEAGKRVGVGIQRAKKPEKNLKEVPRCENVKRSSRNDDELPVLQGKGAAVTRRWKERRRRGDRGALSAQVATDLASSRQVALDALRGHAAVQASTEAERRALRAGYDRAEAMLAQVSKSSKFLYVDESLLKF